MKRNRLFQSVNQGKNTSSPDDLKHLVDFETLFQSIALRKKLDLVEVPLGEKNPKIIVDQESHSILCHVKLKNLKSELVFKYGEDRVLYSSIHITLPQNDEEKKRYEAEMHRILDSKVLIIKGIEKQRGVSLAVYIVGFSPASFAQIYINKLLNAGLREVTYQNKIYTLSKNGEISITQKIVDNAVENEEPNCTFKP